MKILSAVVENFGSYEHLEFDFTKRGLCLISGPTGSGKSTLCDIIPWVLFGVTAKNGAADEVKAWDSKGTTSGRVTVEIEGSLVDIVRERGSKNDLYYECLPAMRSLGLIKYRGKDLNDTQKLINDLLLLNAETYLAGAYFHEFSQTAAFFTAPAKTRRQITEQLVDLSQAKKLTEVMSEYRKELKKERDEKTAKRDQAQAKLDVLNSTANQLEQSAVDWQELKHDRLTALRGKEKIFETDKQNVLAKIEAEHIERTVAFQYDMTDLEKQLVSDKDFMKRRTELQDKHDKLLADGKCLECGAPKNVERLMTIKKSLYDVDNNEKANNQRKIQLKTLGQRLESHMKTLEPKLQAERDRKNTYGEQIAALKKEANPHESHKDQVYEDIRENNKQHNTLTTSIEDLTQELSDVDILLQVTQDLRGVMLTRAVEYLETQTNALLTDHFDAEIKVTFDMGSADKLDVTIQKDGNTCTYSQLSKGQRQMLRLTFGLAVMKQVSNSSGVSFSTIMIDEGLDGFDEDTKLKGFTLLEKLATEYESVFVIDHNEAVKNQFVNRIDIELVNGKSIIA